MTDKALIIEVKRSGFTHATVCHLKGDLQYLGRILADDYVTTYKVGRLINIGPLWTVGENLTPTGPHLKRLARHKDSLTTAQYCQRRNEILRKYTTVYPKDHKNAPHWTCSRPNKLLKNFQDIACDYNYLFQDDRWYLISGPKQFDPQTKQHRLIPSLKWKTVRHILIAIRLSKHRTIKRFRTFADYDLRVVDTKLKNLQLMLTKAERDQRTGASDPIADKFTPAYTYGRAKELVRQFAEHDLMIDGGYEYIVGQQLQQLVEGMVSDIGTLTAQSVNERIARFRTDASDIDLQKQLVKDGQHD